MDYEVLFEPITIGGVKIKNRIAFAPTGMGAADHYGAVTDQNLCHYVARAKGGVGLIIVEHTMSNYKFGLSGSGALGFHRDRNLAGMMELANTIQAFDVAAVVQLSLGLGRQAVLGTEPVGPSPIPYKIPIGSTPRGLKEFEGRTGPIPRELSISEIEELENLFIAAVTRIKKAGFDGIEIHGAHGYLLANFLSPLSNQRTDKYGGSLENRLTLALNLIHKSREAVGRDFIIGFRISGDEHLPGGLSLKDTLQIVSLLEDAGIDYIHLSSGTMESWKYTFPDEDGAITPEAEEVKKVVNIPVICPNFHDPKKAVQAMRAGKVDIVSLSRGLLADPQWPNKVRGGRIDEIQRCLLCNWCLQTLFQGFRTRCATNPNVGRERFIPEYFPPPRKGSGRPI